MAGLSFNNDNTLPPTAMSSEENLCEHSGAGIALLEKEFKQHQRRFPRFGWPWNKRPDRNHGWVPLSLTSPILAAIMIGSLIIAAMIELLAQTSQRQGGLALSPSLEEIPEHIMLSYLYVPTIAAVLYSLVWTWVDLDAKRMQPWLELSKETGASAENSLLLDYPFDFMPFVPFKAAKRRHWPVFLAGTAMLIVFWAITPLQSAILGTDTVTVTEVVSLSNRSELLPVAQQVALMDSAILLDGYGVGWLGQRAPPFATLSYATLPFYVEEDPVPSAKASNWTATTTQLTTSLECWPAEIHGDLTTPVRPPGVQLSFLNGQGCNVTMPLFSPTQHWMHYFGYWSSPHGTHYLASPDCPATEDSIHQFLAIWVDAGPESDDIGPESDDASREIRNITAMFCQPSYHQQQVTVSVDAMTKEVSDDSLMPSGPQEKLTASQFNSSAFEFLLGVGMPDDWQKGRDYPFTFVVEQQPQLESLEINKPVHPMVGFALARQSRPIEELGDPEVLRNMYNEAHQYLFSFAVDRLLTNSTSVTNATGTSSFEMTGIIVSRPIAAAVESLLLVTAICAAIMLWLYSNTIWKLRSNPSSIFRMIEIFRNSQALVRQFAPMDAINEKALHALLKDEMFRLLVDNKDSEGDVTIQRVNTGPSTVGSREQTSRNHVYEPIRPAFLKLRTGLAFMVIFGGAIAGLSYLKSVEGARNGLSRPSNDFVVLQLLENYIPTVFATLLEPFWILLNRILCVLQPLHDLSKGKVRTTHTTEATYSSIPPQLVLWRAIKARHLSLILLCSASLLANVLAVGLGALFNEEQVAVNYTELFQPKLAPIFSNESVSEFEGFLDSVRMTNGFYQDPQYMLMANLSSGTPLPPWVSKQFFFQPRSLATESPHEARATSYKLSTQGFGARINCTGIPAMEMPVNMTEPSTPPDGECPDPVEQARYAMGGQVSLSGRSAIEYSPRTINESLWHCDQTLVWAWGRSRGTDGRDEAVEASFASCTPTFETALFDIEVDKNGRVLTYERKSEVNSTLPYPDSSDYIDRIIAHANRMVASARQQWHNDTFSEGWMSYLMMQSMGSRQFLDPEEPVPDPEEMIPTIQDLYQQLFAIFLGLNHRLFDATSPDISEEAILVVPETRIFMDFPSFVISLTVLTFNILVAATFYMNGAGANLPRMPTTIGSVLAYVAPSRLVSESSQSLPGQSTRTLSLGRYVGHDGHTHFGIEYDPHVVPIGQFSLLKRLGEHRNLRSIFKRGNSIDETGMI